MKVALLLLFICFESCILGTQSKPCLRALIIGDTVSKNIKIGSKIDIYRMKKSLCAIAHQIHYRPKVSVFTGENLSNERLSRWVRSIKKNSRDIVFFYFTGHGGRSTNQTQPLPHLTIPTIKPKKTILVLNGEHIFSIIANKHAHLGICILDCCNNASPGIHILDKSILSSSIVPKNRRLLGLKTLFVKTHGLICIAAASPGQSAVTAIGGPHPGGFLTTSLLHTIIVESKTTQTSWEKICQGSSSYLKNVLKGRQQPMYFLHLPEPKAKSKRD